MRRSLLLVAALLAAVLSPVSGQAPGGHVMVDPGSLTWRGGNGISTAIAEGDPAMPGRFTMMLKLADGAYIPPHWHNVDKRLIVVSGLLTMGMGDAIDEAAVTVLGPGGVVVVPALSHHYEGGKGETIVALIADGPFTTTYVDGVTRDQ